MVGLNPLDLGNGSRRRALEDAPGHGDTVTPLRLIRPLDDLVWLGEADGGWVTARRIAAPPDRLVPEAWLPGAAVGWPDDEHPHLIAPRGTATLDGSTWIISPYHPGIRLDRLTTRAILTALQAAYLSIDVAAGLVELHAAGLVHGRLREQAVLVGEDGRSRLTDWATAVPVAADAHQSLRRDDLKALRALIARLARGADRPVARRREADARLLTGLITLSADRPGGDAAAYLAELTALVLDCRGAELPDVDVRAQVAAVARAAAERGPHRGAAERDGHTSRRTRPEPLPTTTLTQAVWRKPRRRRRWLVAGVVAITVLATAGFVARKPITSLADRLLNRHAATTATAPARPRPLKPVPKFAPTAAGPIRAVTVRAISACRPGSSCRIRVTVYARPRRGRHPVRWTVRTFDRCTGAEHARAGGVVVLASRARSGTSSRSLAVPQGRAVAAVVLTTAPARTAARPLLIPAGAKSC